MDLKVRVSTNMDGEPAASYGGGHELGEGGMAVYVPLEFRIGQEVRVEFQIPAARSSFRLRALVRNANGYRYGIEFIEVRDSEREELKRSLQVLAPKSVLQKPAHAPTRQIAEEQCFEHVVVTFDASGQVEASDFFCLDISDAGSQDPPWPDWKRHQS